MANLLLKIEMIRKLLFFQLITTALLSCCNVAFKYDKELVRGLPTNPRWKLKGKLKESELKKLDINCVYILQGEDNYEAGKYRPAFVFFRFWEDGHVMFRNYVLFNFPTIKDINSNYGTMAGYFTISNDIITIEMFGCWVWRWRYTYAKYKIINGDIKCISGDCSTDEAKYPYKKYCLGTLTSKPDW